MYWQNKIKAAKNAGEYLGRFVSSNAHAQQAIPAQHRLLSAGGMFLGWVAGDKVRDAAFGVNQTSEGEFVELKREDIPLILRPIYHTIKWDPQSDAPADKWKKLLHQSIPAVVAAGGTLAGSEMVFQLNGRAAGIMDARNLRNPVSALTADKVVEHGQSFFASIGTALTGGAGASSMLPIVYGALLNLRFLLANGGKINIGNAIGGNVGPEKAIMERMAKVAFYAKSAANKEGKLSKDWAVIYVKEGMKPLFPEKLNTREKEEEAIEIVHKKLQNIYDKHYAKGLRDDNLINAVSDEVKHEMGDAAPTLNKEGKIEYHGFDKLILKDMKYSFDDVKLGNAVPIVRAATELAAEKAGIRKEVSAGAQEERIRNQYINSTSHATVGIA
jgi:hypothetical protein